jgi:8-oxo-dGTP pyrophosphatase MutT (NUDIX family)
MPREKSAGVIIFRKEAGKIYYLLLHYPGMNRKGGHWEFTKGHIENNETEEDAAIRETREETGISDLKILPGFKEYIKYFFKQNFKKEPLPRNIKNNKKVSWIFKLVVFFVAETQIKEIKISAEHLNYIWLPFEEAVKKTTYKNSKELLKKVNDFLNLKAK